jgi:RNA-binding protein Musashi
LRDNVTEEEFKAYFETFGAVTDVVVIYDSLTNKSRGFGFVTFDSEEDVNKVMRQGFHNLNGTKVEVKIAIPRDEQCYRSRGCGGWPFGMRGPVNYEGLVYQPVYNGYMPQPVPTQPFYPPLFSVPYGCGYPSQGVMTNVPTVYGAYPQLHPGFNFVSTGGFGDPAATFQNGFNGGSDNKKEQTTVENQDVVSTASIATKLEHMKLGSQ